jgi:ribosome-associated protein
MIEINQKISINEDEIHLNYIRASGPGGQKVNKASSAVQLRFNAENSPSLPEDVRARLMQIAGKRVTDDGTIIIEASQQRTQEGNRRDAINRLVELIREATKKPKERKKTEPTKEAKQRRLDEKHQQSQKKKERKKIIY